MDAAYDDSYAQYMVDINHTLTPGLCISSDTNYPDEAAQLCLEFAKRVNERNVTQYDYVDFVNGSGLEAPSEEALAVRQFHEQLDQAVHYTPLWYAVLEKEDGDNWRNLTRKLLGGAVNQEEFVQDAAVSEFYCTVKGEHMAKKSVLEKTVYVPILCQEKLT